MAEVLGVASSIIAVLQLCNSVAGYLQDVKDASKTKDRLLEQILATQALLQVLTELSDDAKRKRQGTFLLLEKPLAAFSATLTKLAERLKPGGRWKTVKDAAVWSFQKVEIQQILQQVESQKTLFMLALQNDDLALSRAIDATLQDVKLDILGLSEGIDSLKITFENEEEARMRRLEDKEYAEVVHWLSEEQSWAQQADNYKQAQSGTGTWLLEHDKFDSWIHGDPPILWCPGMPGAGKTVLSSIVIEYLRGLQQNEDFAVAWYYCTYRSSSTQSVQQLLAAVLSQLVQRHDRISDSLRACFRVNSRKRARPSVEELTELIQEEVESCQKAYFVIDGLDEFPDQDAREQLTLTFRDLEGHAQLFVTSRPLGDIEVMFADDPRLEIRATDPDVARYVGSHIENRTRLKRQIRKYPTLKEILTRKIIASAQGMFLMARLHLEAVTKMDNPQDIEDTLDKLPLTYNDIYNDAIQRVRERDPYQTKRALEVLTWLSYTLAPLTVDAIRHGLAVKEESRELNERSLPDPEDLLTVCGGLVVIDSQTGIMRLVHYTTQEYFRSNRETLLPQGDLKLATACLRYLSYENFAEADTEWEIVWEMDMGVSKYPLLHYAAEHWASHVVRGIYELELQETIVRYLQDPKRFRAEQVMLRKRRDGYAGIWQRTPFRDPSRGHVRHDPPLHTAAVYNLPVTISFLISDRQCAVNEFNKLGETPLHRAADTGSDAAVDALAKHGASIGEPLKQRANRIGNTTPLHLAANGGHLSCIQALLDHGADVNIREPTWEYMPLHIAATMDTEVVELLLSRGARADELGPVSPHYIEQGPFTSLHFLMMYFLGEDCVRRAAALLEHGCNVNAQTGLGNTALHQVVIRDKPMSAFLISKGADIRIQNEQGRTPLELACEKGNLMWIAKEEGLEPLVKAMGSPSPLHLALWTQDDEAALHLLRRGADITAQDSTGRTPLDYSVTSYNLPVLQAILSASPLQTLAPIAGGPIFDTLVYAIADYEYRTPETWALLVSMARLLLPYRIAHTNDLSFAHARTQIGGYNKTLLIHAAEAGLTALAEFYLDCGADVNAADIFGSTGASYGSSNVQMLKLFVERGFDLDKRPVKGGTDAAKAYLMQVKASRAGAAESS